MLVIDDGSSDGTGAFARELGATVLAQREAQGPAAARNRGAAAAGDVDILMFVDADVVVADDAIERVRAALADPAIAAVVGSYDEHPADTSCASLYVNLRHHALHTANEGRIRSFWAGLGAVRARVFREACGFDAERFSVASVEDIEFGARLDAAGHAIVLDPRLRGRHLKRWTLPLLWRTDIRHRALPWARLVLSGAAPARELNLALGERAAALVACALPPAALAPFFLGACATALPVSLLALAALLNRHLLATFVHCRGPGFAATALLMHQLYYLYSSLVYLYCAVERHLRPSR